MQVVNTKLSGGAKRDLLILNLCFGLIKTSLDKDKYFIEDEDLTKRTNKNYKLNKRIDRRLEKLMNKLQYTQNNIYSKYGRDGELGIWAKKKLDSILVKTINSMSPVVNLELLANQLLFENFIERKQPLIEEFEWLGDINEYELFDLLIETEAGIVTEETYNEAKRIKMVMR